MKTQNEVRRQFWIEHPELKGEYKRTYRQNQYNATIRSQFVTWVDILQKDGRISEKLADRVTLGPYYIKVKNMGNFDFWIGCFRPRTDKWKRETLKRLNAKQSPFETAQERTDKIEALKFLLQ
jgi:hypothetical protein